METFIAEDFCNSGQHDCDTETSECENTGVAQFQCNCLEGYVRDGDGICVGKNTVGSQKTGYITLI